MARCITSRRYRQGRTRCDVLCHAPPGKCSGRMHCTPPEKGDVSQREVWGFRFRVSGFRFRISDFGSRVSGFGFRDSGFRFGVSDFGSRVWDFGSRVPGFRFQVCASGRRQAFSQLSSPASHLHARKGGRVGNAGARVCGHMWVDKSHAVVDKP